MQNQPQTAIVHILLAKYSRFTQLPEVSLQTNMYCVILCPLLIPPPVNVSKPRISFSISKEGASYHGNVTCWSTRGSPPVNFSLTLDDREVGSVTAAESLTAWFPVDMVPGLDMGVAQCRVTTEVQELTSEPVTLVVGMSCIDNRSKCVFPWLPTLFVLFDDLFLFLYPTVCAVPVGGNVKVEVEYLYRADSKLAAARLSCQVSRGTFPYVSWLFNNSVLPSETHVDSNIQPALSQYAVADHRRTLFLANLGPEESGYYRCKARDSYDDSGPWVESPAMLVRVTGEKMKTRWWIKVWHFGKYAYSPVYQEFDGWIDTVFISVG